MRITLAVGLCLIAFAAVAAPRGKTDKPQVENPAPSQNLRENYRSRLNENVVTIMAGSPSGTDLSIATDIAQVVDDGDNLRVLPIVGRGVAQNVKDVLFLRDEMANVAWAVERVVQSPAGRPLDRFEAYQETRRRKEGEGGASPGYTPPEGTVAYRLGTTVPDYWIPLLPIQHGTSIRLKRGALPRLASDGIEGALEPQGRVLEPGHELLLHDEEVPREGARVTRAYQYARWIDGSTHLWIGRRKQPGRGEGSSGLRFDSISTED